MTLTDLRTLLKDNGYKTNEPVDRVDLRRYNGQIIGVDIMFTNGDIAYLPIGSD